MLKTNSGFRSSKAVKKINKILFQPNLTSLLTLETKQSFQKLKKNFWKESILQHFDMSKRIKFEINISEKVIRGVFCQQDKEMNWYLVAYYLCKMLLAKQNYETYDTKLLAIIENFKTYCLILKELPTLF